MYTKYLSFQKHALTNVVKYPADLFLSMIVSLLITRLDTGEKIYLHNHNVRFEDVTKEIVLLYCLFIVLDLPIRYKIEFSFIILECDLKYYG